MGTFRRAMAAFMGRRLLQEEDDTPTVTFPDDYPNSVRHFLLIGFLGMFIGAIVFFYMGISPKSTLSCTCSPSSLRPCPHAPTTPRGLALGSRTRPPTPPPVLSSGLTPLTGSSPARSFLRTSRSC